MERIILQSITVDELKEIITDVITIELEKVLNNQHKQKTYTVKEAASHLQCSEQSIRSYIKKGFLPAFGVGRRIIIKAMDLENALLEVKSLSYRR